MSPVQSLSVIVAGAATLILAPDGFAQDVRVAVGDLSVPAQARDFEQRLEAEVTHFCMQRYDPTALSEMNACRNAARKEAVDHLSHEQRLALAAALGPETALAKAAVQFAVDASTSRR